MVPGFWFLVSGFWFLVPGSRFLVLDLSAVKLSAAICMEVYHNYQNGLGSIKKAIKDFSQIPIIIGTQISQMLDYKAVKLCEINGNISGICKK